MSARQITSLMRLNRNLTSGAPAVREFRLPRLSPLPKLDRARVATPGPVAARRAPPVTAVAIIGHASPLPEMTSDLAGPSGGYTVGNVKRSDALRSGSGRSAWAHLVGRLLGGQPSARW
ncbi:hypothetical protein HQ590_04965 [bacterium]|nr:hypothetical protein [bacterium]